MTGEMFDSPTRILVNSESGSQEPPYLVELTDFPIQVNGENGEVIEVFNGSCQCKNFICSLRPRLRDPKNKAFYRCKHILWARQHALDRVILPFLKKTDKNTPDEYQA